MPLRKPTVQLAMIVRALDSGARAAVRSAQLLCDGPPVIVYTGPGPAPDETGAIVLKLPWADDFSAARNAALAAVRGPWALILDDDETIEPAWAGDELLGARVRSILTGRQPDCAWALSVHHCGAWPWQMSLDARIIPSTWRYRHRVHNVLCEPDDLPGQIARTDLLPALRVVHTGYTAGAAAAKRERAMRLLQLEIDGGNDLGVVRFYAAREHWRAGNAALALSHAAAAAERLEGEHDRWRRLYRAPLLALISAMEREAGA